jgi:hypothetical protein
MRPFAGLVPFVLVGVIVAIVVFAWDGSCSVEAQAALRPAYPISKGERGQRVCDALWLLSGRKPAVRTEARWRIYRGPIRKGRSCVWNKAAQKAAIKAKYRLGYKQWQISSTFSRKLRAYLRGERKRPRVYLELQSKRVVLERKLAAQEQWAQRLIAAERSQLGIRETWSSNWGPQVRLYLAVSGIRGPAPWCMAFQQWSRLRAQLNTVAYRTAHVFTFVSYAQRKGWIRAKPAPGYHVAFMERSGHVGLVWKVYQTGIVTLEGNSQNSVRSRFIPHGSRRLIFIRADASAR